MRQEAKETEREEQRLKCVFHEEDYDLDAKITVNDKRKEVT